MSRSRAWLRTILAWAATVALLGWLFSRIPLAQVAGNLDQVSAGSLVVAALILAAIFAFDSWATWSTFRALGHSARLAEIAVARGSSYLLASVNYVAGQGGLAILLTRQGRATARQATVAMLVIAFANLLVLVAFSLAGVLTAPDVPALLPKLMALALAGIVIFAALVLTRPAPLSGLPLVGDLLQPKLGSYLRAAVVRVPHVIALLAYSLWWFRVFGVQVPVAEAAIYMPIVYLIALLPISVQGLGTSQAAMISFFSRFAPGDGSAQQARILASSLTAFAVMVVFQSLLALVCLRLGRRAPAVAVPGNSG